MHGIGYIDEEGHIESCYNVGTVKENYTGNGGTVGIGGIVGYNYNGDIKNCYNIGKIDTKRDVSVESIAGFSESESIINCYYTMDSQFKGLGNIIETSKMKDYSFVNKINSEDGESFIYDTNNINNGYPILYWQKNKIEQSYNGNYNENYELNYKTTNDIIKTNSNKIQVTDDIIKIDSNKLQSTDNTINEESSNTNGFIAIISMAIVISAIIIVNKISNKHEDIS